MKTFYTTTDLKIAFVAGLTISFVLVATAASFELTAMHNSRADIISELAIEFEDAHRCNGG